MPKSLRATVSSTLPYEFALALDKYCAEHNLTRSAGIEALLIFALNNLQKLAVTPTQEYAHDER